jgi:hypothetical protein
MTLKTLVIATLVGALAACETAQPVPAVVVPPAAPLTASPSAEPPASAAAHPMSVLDSR